MYFINIINKKKNIINIIINKRKQKIKKEIIINIKINNNH